MNEYINSVLGDSFSVHVSHHLNVDIIKHTITHSCKKMLDIWTPNGTPYMYAESANHLNRTFAALVSTHVRGKNGMDWIYGNVFSY